MSLHHLILGLLNTQPQSGYDLNKRFQETVQNFWSTDQSQIYRALYKLEDNGWIRMEYVAQEGNPDKKLYHITDTGRDELISWITTPINDKQSPTREGWLGQLFFGGMVDNKSIIALLDSYRLAVQQRLSDLERIHQDLQQKNEAYGHGVRDLELIMLTTDYGIVMLRATYQWLETTITKISNMQEDSSK